MAATPCTRARHHSPVNKLGKKEVEKGLQAATGLCINCSLAPSLGPGAGEPKGQAG